MLNVKNKILDEIMNLMDNEDGKKLMKHPKLVAAKITIAKPIDKEEMKKDAESEDEGMAHEMEEGPAFEKKEDSMPEELMNLLESMSDEEKKQFLKYISK